MPDLIAQGEQAQQRWRRQLPEGEAIVLGRRGNHWAIPWDPHISRQHVRLLLTGNSLEIEQFPQATNPVFFQGREAQHFALDLGEHFVIGNTRFHFVDQHVDMASDVPDPIQQQSFSTQYLRQIPFRHPDHRLEVLSRLPEVIAGATGDEELCVRLVGMLLAGAPRTDASAVISIEGDSDEEISPSNSTVEVLHWDRRTVGTGNFYPSRRLIFEALRQRQSILHVWHGTGVTHPEAFTASGDFDWAFCTPVPGPSSGTGWCFYVAGRFNKELPEQESSSDPTDLYEDMKFTELVAAMLGSLRQMRQLEREHAHLSQFFSPLVLESLSREDPEVALKPRETEVSVLFCDLQGFTRETERHADDLPGLLHRVGKALGVMTHQILDHGGVVGDFQGDAAMGFWGWPLAQDDAVPRICRAALGIRAEFKTASKDASSPLAGFHVGLGVATGRAVAGEIGTVDQVKVTVFGPVVNLASRLEGMTRFLHAPILLDEVTARIVRQQVPRHLARVRRLAVVRPYGLDTPLEISELLPPESDYPDLTEEHIACYESALDAFLAGRWIETLELLHRLPTTDRVTDYLTVYIARHNRTAPRNWKGVIELSSK